MGINTAKLRNTVCNDLVESFLREFHFELPQGMDILLAVYLSH